MSLPKKSKLTDFEEEVMRVSDVVTLVMVKRKNKPLYKNTVEVFANGHTPQRVKEYEENLDGTKHLIIVDPSVPAKNFKNLTVPIGKYFMMEDESDDSQGWGLAPVENFIGEGQIVFFNMTLSPFHIHWDRIGKKFTL